MVSEWVLSTPYNLQSDIFQVYQKALFHSATIHLPMRSLLKLLHFQIQYLQFIIDIKIFNLRWNTLYFSKKTGKFFLEKHR